MLGCTNPNADNYNPAATEDDASCVYTFPGSGGLPRFFRDVTDLVDKSFTLSYSVEGKNWAFFHDYIPDFYFHTREHLWSGKAKRLFKHNSGPFGLYYKEDAKAFFIDMVFSAESDLLLETVKWITEVLVDKQDNSSINLETQTLSHISIWNSQQHSGKVPLRTIMDGLGANNARKTQGEWIFDDFRNVLADRGTAFLMDIFHDYALIPGAALEKGWYAKELLEDKYFVIRFEFDNLDGNQLALHSANIQALKSDR